MTKDNFLKISLHLVVIAVFAIMQILFGLAEFRQLTFMLVPVNNLLQLLIGTESNYIDNVGFYFQSYNFILDKSCSGYNLWSYLFLVVSIFFNFKLIDTKNKLILLPLVLIMTYLASIFVNLIRILVSLFAQIKASIFLTDRPHYLIHEIIGVIINVSFILLTFFLINYFFNKRRKNATIT